ncbi:MAG: hypothetical protein NT099_00450 [Candidatus Saganbacteria bacterium]|nr:hypothetical protein [Candidatus Saganbacteria bacterium]
MLYTLNITPNSVAEFLTRGGGDKKSADNIGLGFLENLKEAIIKDNQLQVANKGEASRVDFLKPEKVAYREHEDKEEEEPEELIAKIKHLAALLKQA